MQTHYHLFDEDELRVVIVGDCNCDYPPSLLLFLFLFLSHPFLRFQHTLYHRHPTLPHPPSFPFPPSLLHSPLSQAAPMQHTIPCVGYVITEKTRPGRLKFDEVRDGGGGVVSYPDYL